MRTALMFLAVLGLLGLAQAGEAAKPKPTAKEMRISDIAWLLKTYEAEKMRWANDPKKKDVLAEHQARVPDLQTELAWLKGELTLKQAEEKVKAATDAIKKAEEAKDQPAADKAKADLAVATKQVEVIKALEAKAEF